MQRATPPDRAALRGYRAVRRLVGEDGDEYQDRRQYDLEDFLEIEDPGMIELFRYWRDLRIANRGRALPSYDQFRIERVVEIGMHERFNLIDVQPDAPGAFSVRLQATISFVRSHVDLRAKPLAGFSSRLHSEGLQQDYQEIKQLGQPRYHGIRNRVDGRDRAYGRLTLPFASDGRNVDTLLLGVSLATVRPLVLAAE